MATGDKLREWMIAEKMTQKALADALSMSEATVSLFVNGVREPSSRFIWRFADRYGFGTARLLFGNGTKEAQK